MSKPSDFCGYPWNSILEKSESETIAVNIMVILRRTGDTWRDLTWEEYKAERLQDGRFSEIEKRYFEEVYPLIRTEELARRFSSKWREAAA